MSGTKEIKNRIKSVKDTQKITNAMYLIASTKMRKAKEALDATRPYFTALQAEIKRIFRTAGDVENQYFYPVTGEHDLGGSYGYLVVTADKGLAGAYNQNVIKEALSIMSQHPDPKLFVVGEYGRHYFESHHIPIEESFLYTAQNPTFQRARDICSILLDRFNSGELSKIFIVFTDLENGMNVGVRAARLLPFHRAQFATAEQEKAVTAPFDFNPSLTQLLDHIVPSYVAGFIYGALVDSFCCEQDARMTAMDAATRNAEELLEKLTVRYNHVRQGAITQEITEISSGAKWQKLKNQQKGDLQ